MKAPEFIVRELRYYERDLALRLPFHFGSATVRTAIQVFVRARITLTDGRDAWGVAAELMVPKWFDKNPSLSHEDNADQLRRALALTREAYCTAGRTTAYALLARSNEALLSEGRRQGLKDLVVNFGPAVIDRAVLDALCRALGISFSQAMCLNVPGLTREELPPDLAQFDIDRFLSGLRPQKELFVRHTIGKADALTRDLASPWTAPDDDLPVSLEEVLTRHAPRYFKIKVGGDVADDIARLTAITAILDRRQPEYAVTLDGNEQYEEIARVGELLTAISRTSALQRLWTSVLFLEQPLNRERAFDSDVRILTVPVIIDESDGNRDAFLLARDRGYAGVSSKGCKGVYRALINAARCANWNAGTTQYFMSAEDLTCPAGITLQQDLALASLLRLGHTERNGHHFVGDAIGAPAHECEAFQAAHPDLYENRPGRLRLRIASGKVRTSSLSCVGFASVAEPDWTSMREAPLENTT